MLSFFAFLPLGIKAGRRPVTSYYGGGDAMIPMRIDYVVGTAIAIVWEHLLLEESQVKKIVLPVLSMEWYIGVDSFIVLYYLAIHTPITR